MKYGNLLNNNKLAVLHLYFYGVFHSCWEQTGDA